MKSIAIIGASIGGLVAAAELRDSGFGVTIFEASKSVAGMYGMVETPFGTQELGMHVLYLTKQHYTHLCTIFGADTFHTWTGPSVDLGGHHNFGKSFFGSIYPDLRGHTELETIRREVLADKGHTHAPTNGFEAVVRRFGEEAGRKVYAPILKKLWKADAELLSADAIHCFYDLRRVVLWNKEEADRIKSDPSLDEVVANPDQRQPRSEVFGGRMAAQFKHHAIDLGGRVQAWLERSGIRMENGKAAEVRNGRLWVGDSPLDEEFQACIVATPVPPMIPKILPSMDTLELSIYYFRLAERMGTEFPTYYMLMHDDRLLSSRMVNYDAYKAEGGTIGPPVICVEVAHRIGSRPTIEIIAAEVREVLPTAVITESFLFPRSLKVPIPSINNGRLIDEATVGLASNFDEGALYFTGMRTDKGIFFSHHTIGLAYESALDCARRLS